MFLGLKNKTNVSVTLTALQIWSDVDTQVAISVSLPVVITAGSTLFTDINNQTFIKINFSVEEDVSSLFLVAKNSVNDAVVEVVTTAQSGADATLNLNQSNIANQLLLLTYTNSQLTALTSADVSLITFLNSTKTQRAVIIAALAVEVQALFTSTPIQFIQTPEQIVSDKLRLDQIIFKLKSGQFVNDDDSVFYSLNNSLMATAAMLIIDAGGGFDELRITGLTQSQALSVLSIYNVNLDVSKYESEVSLKLLNDDPTKFTSLAAYLAGLTPPLTLPPLTAYLSTLRSDHAVYTAIKNWSGS
jgi:hypothetical protein